MIELKPLHKKDYKKAIQFAVKGMHFDMYLDNSFLRNLYGRYFLYNEMNLATHVIAAYSGETLAGLLLARTNEGKSMHHSFWEGLYVKIFNWIQETFFKDSAGLYDEINREMLVEYKKTHDPDGEIIFLAANPEISEKGIGSKLLAELERREPGKEFYLYTDDFCTYQFYEHRGFERVGNQEVTLELGKKETKMICMLFSKKFAD